MISKSFPKKYFIAAEAHKPDSSLNVLVLGIGNILLSDEGAGVKAVEKLKNQYRFPDEVEIIDGGTMGIELLSIFDNRSHIILVDAIKSGNPPGTIIDIPDPPAFLRQRISPHQIGICDVLALAGISEDLSCHISLIGIEPENLSAGLELSPEVSCNMDTLVENILSKIRLFGIEPI